MSQRRRAKTRGRSSEPGGRSAAGGLVGGLERLGVGLLWLVILVPPVLVLPDLAEPFRLPKQVAAELLGLASVLSLCLARALGAPDAATGGSTQAATDGPANGVTGRWPVALVALAPLLLVSIASFALSAHGAHGRLALGSLATGIVCVVGWSVLLDRERLEAVLGGLVIPGTALAALGLAQAAGWFQPFDLDRIVESSRLGVSSLAGNVGDLGLFLVLPALVAQYRLARRRSGEPWVRWALALAVLVAGIAASRTITAVAALAVGSAVLWIAGRASRRRVLVGSAAAVLLVLVAGGLLVQRAVDEGRAGAAIGEAAARPFTERLVSSADRVLTGRLSGWRAALWMAGERPLLGVGPGAYRAEFGHAKLALVEDGVEFFAGSREPYFANAHDEPLEVLAETGVLGLLAALWVPITLGVWRRRRGVEDASGDAPEAAEDADSGARRGLLLAGLAALGLACLVWFPLRVALVAYPWLLFLAWAFADGRPGPTLPAAVARPRGRSLVIWAGVLVTAVLLLVQSLQGLGRLEASRVERTVERVSIAAVQAGRVPPTLVADNLRAVRAARELAPSRVSLVLIEGSQHLVAGRPERAAEIYRQGLELEPRPELYLNLGRAHHALGEREEAIEAYVAALRLDPHLRRQVPLELRPAVRDRL